MKRLRDSSSEERSSNRREVTFYTYKKWMTELDRSFKHYHGWIVTLYTLD